MGDEFAEGVFIGEHGGWNRADPGGYKVVFVPFSNGHPDGDPIDFVTGFLTDASKTRGRPVGVTVAPDGAVIIADDLSNAVWRVTREGANSSQNAPATAGNEAVTSEDAPTTPEDEPTPSS